MEVIPEVRKIIHIDMDAFYASVEMKDHPEFIDKPVIVGGSPQSRGVVCAANYQARSFGIHSAMPCSTAYKKCPDAVFIQPRFERYKEISGVIHQIFRQYTDTIEALALDEAWLDVTSNHKQEKSATLIAEQIRKQVFNETGLTCSAGVSYNKFLAKVATEINKPNGIFVLPPEKSHEFLMKLPIKKIPGVGPVTEKKLASLGIQTGKDAYDKDKDWLMKHFGKFGSSIYHSVRGEDQRPVVPYREAKSISVERTFSEDLTFQQLISEKLDMIVDQLIERIKNKSKRGKTFHLKVKFFDFQQTTRNISLDHWINSKNEILALAKAKLTEIGTKEIPHKKVRLLGIGLSGFKEKSTIQGQLDFFNLL